MDLEAKDICKHVSLHLHTEYSLLDGASRIKDLVKKAKENNMPAVAITDHGVMYGALELYREATNEGIKPIVGCEVYVVNGDYNDKSSRSPLYHLILLAKNDEGYVNLSKIVSESNLKGFYYKPRINKEFLKKHNKGLIALTACLGGEVPNTLLKNQYEEARSIAEQYKEIYGEDFYLEIQDHEIPEEHFVIPLMKKLSLDLNVKLVATNDSHFTNKEDGLSHDAILCLQTNKFVTDFPRMHFTGNEYIKNGREMMGLFSKQLSPEEIYRAVHHNPLEITEKIGDYKLLSGNTARLPKFPVPKDHTNKSYLEELVWKGITRKYSGLTEEIKQRTKYELEIIFKLGFEDYFLIVWDFIKFAKDRGIAVGPGRGSAAGSIVAFALDVTDIDPIKYNLLFERFLNPERKSMPDIDTDFCIERRDEVLQYVKEKYGSDRVAQIITFNKLASRAVIKDIARVLNFPYSESEKIAKLIPVIRGKPRELNWMKENHSEFSQIYKTNSEFKQIFDVAERLEGINKNFGVHAAGVVISDRPLDELVPLSKNNEGNMITQYSMDDLAHLGLLKMDFLGLRNLTMVDKAINIIKETRGEEININKIPLDNEKVFETISKGDLAGIFQLETSSGMKQVARDMKPSKFEDLSALIALYRPGPLDTGMVDEFIDRKNGKKSISYLVPELEPILKDTYGSIVYQEQIMQIAQKLAGFSLGQADLLRKAMGKKKPMEMAKFRLQFTDGCKANGHSAKVAEELFDMMVSFAEYCFNKSHSAAYGMITYQTAYLKANYPLEYFTALLSSVLHDQDKIKYYMAECKRLKIAILPPDINYSGVNFTADLTTNSIRFGLAAIKNVGIQAIEEVIKIRSEGGAFVSLEDFCTRVDQKALNKKTLESLIKSGAFDSLNQKRKVMIESLENIIGSVLKKREILSSGQLNLFGSSGTSLLINALRSETKDEEFSSKELQLMEKELTGFYISSHPFDNIPAFIQGLCTCNLSELKEMKDGSIILTIGILNEVNKKLTKTNKLIGILQLEDLLGKAEAVIFSEELIRYGELLTSENILLIEGRVQQKIDGGEPSIQIKAIQPLEDIKVVMIELPPEISDDDSAFGAIHSIRSIIQTEKPNSFSPIMIVANRSNGNGKNKKSKFLLNNKLWVEPTENLIARLSQFNKSIKVNIVNPLKDTELLYN